MTLGGDRFSEMNSQLLNQIECNVIGTMLECRPAGSSGSNSMYIFNGVPCFT